MACTEEHKVLFGTHMLSEEAEDWWDNTRQILEVVGAEITWTVFRVQLLEKYFPEDVRSKKEIEFLELKQGNMTIAEYAAKFEELVKFYPHYNGASLEGSKCIKFENRVRPKIKLPGDLHVSCFSEQGFMMRTARLVLLTTRVLMRGRGRINPEENHTVLQLTKGNK